MPRSDEKSDNPPVSLTGHHAKGDVPPFHDVDWWTIPPSETTLDDVRRAGMRLARRNLGDALRFGRQYVWQLAVNAGAEVGTPMLVADLCRAMGISESLGRRWARLWERFVADPVFRSSLPLLTLMQAYEAAGLRVKGKDPVTGDGVQPEVTVPNFDGGEPDDPRDVARDAAATLAKLAILAGGDATLDVLLVMLRSALALSKTPADWDRKWVAQKSIGRRLERLVADLSQRRDWLSYLWAVIDDVNAADTVVADHEEVVADPDAPGNTGSIDGLGEGFHVGDLGGRWTPSLADPSLDDAEVASTPLVPEPGDTVSPEAVHYPSVDDAFDVVHHALDTVGDLDEDERALLADRFVDLAEEAAGAFGNRSDLLERLQARGRSRSIFFVVTASTPVVISAEITVESMVEDALRERNIVKCVVDATSAEAAIQAVRAAADGGDADLDDPELELWAQTLSDRLRGKTTIKQYLRLPRSRRIPTLKEYVKSLKVEKP